MLQAQARRHSQGWGTGTTRTKLAVKRGRGRGRGARARAFRARPCATAKTSTNHLRIFPWSAAAISRSSTEEVRDRVRRPCLYPLSRMWRLSASAVARDAAGSGVACPHVGPELEESRRSSSGGAGGSRDAPSSGTRASAARSPSPPPGAGRRTATALCVRLRAGVHSDDDMPRRRRRSRRGPGNVLQTPPGRDGVPATVAGPTTPRTQRLRWCRCPQESRASARFGAPPFASLRSPGEVNPRMEGARRRAGCEPVHSPRRRGMCR